VAVDAFVPPMILGLNEVCRAHDYRLLMEAAIPEEIAVVGYDDIPAAAFAFPPLTTVRSLAYEQGKIAGEAVIDLINGKEPGRKTSIVPLELVIRESCGARGQQKKRKTKSASAPAN
jgi:Periplasmic binding protein-like domain